MNFARVVGTVVASEKLPCFHGEKLLLIQPLNEKLENVGSEIIATDVTSSGEGEIVFYETGREAAIALKDTWNVSDATVMAIVDSIHQEKSLQK